MIIELGVTAAYNLFSQQDFKVHDDAIKEAEEKGTADERHYFLDIKVCILWLNLFLNDEAVKSIKFKSIKEKMQIAMKVYEKSFM